AIYPQAVTDGKDTIFAIYAQLSITTDLTPLFAAKSTDGGRTFTAPVMISPPDAAILEFSPVLALSSDGTPYVLYHSFIVQQDTRPGFIIISGPSINMISAPDGTHFTPATLVAAGVYAPGMILDSKNNIYISYVALVLSGSQRSQQVMVIRSSDKGTSFSIPIRASDATSVAVTASAMGFDRNGNLALAWTDGEFGSSLQTVLTTSLDGGVSFGAVANASSSPGQSSFSFIANMPDGSITALFPDDSPENRDLFSAVLPGPGVAAPDFALLDQALTVSRGTAGKLVVSISRPGGFAGDVTVSAPSGLPRGITISQTQVTTATTNATFDLAVAKKRVNRGVNRLVFAAKDESGRQRSATITLTIQ